MKMILKSSFSMLLMNGGDFIMMLFNGSQELSHASRFFFKGLAGVGNKWSAEQFPPAQRCDGVEHPQHDSAVHRRQKILMGFSLVQYDINKKINSFQRH